ncbi:MAG: MFS transporter, partial [Sphingomonadaceae bacterium]|nr:MFS transporter [Sphingomonadaceae bacterium]
MTADTGASGNSRILAASLVGTAIEFYDFYIYATAASLVFGPLFFPAESASAQLLASYASFGLAFVARPVGSVVFGHFGDRVGRKSTLVASLLLMGGSTLLIAFLPTYAAIGWVAPLLLCILRFGQGFGLGGEWGGAALLAVENAPPGWRGRFGMFPQLGAPVGFLLANGLFLILGTMLSAEE